MRTPLSLALLAVLGCGGNDAFAQHRHDGQADDPPAAGHADHAQHTGHADHPQATTQDDEADHAGHEDRPQPAQDDEVDHSRHAGQAGRPDRSQHSAKAGEAGHAQHAGHAADPAATLPREPIPAITDADRAAAFPELSPHAMEHAPRVNRFLRFNRFEAWDADEGSGQAWEAGGWIGGDVQRLWIRSEGEREGGSTGSADLELLYGRSVSPWWDLVAGVRHDFRPGPSQSWAAFGIQGLAPYRFEVSATAYVGESGRTMAILEAEYDMLLTNRLILQPLVELTVHGKDDPQRGIGSGLGKAEAGLRLRYEFSRRFAPYVGVTHERTFGGTADRHRDAGEPTRDTRVVAGVRFWF